MRPFVRFSGLAAVGIVTLVAGSLGACAPNTSAPVLQSGVAAQATTVSSEILAVAQATAEPTLLVFEDDACLDCHTDQTRLTELALPVEQVESLSSGPG